MKIGFIGAGTVGSALARRLSQKGYDVVAVSSRTPVSSERLAKTIPGCHAMNNNQTVADVSDLVFITTPDNAIAGIVAEIQWHTGQSVVHCSGADTSLTLEPARKQGANVGTFHPLQTFANPEQALKNLPGSTFATEGEDPLLGMLIKMADDLDCRHILLRPENKVLYHASAVILSNYAVTLMKMATDLWETFGISQEEATAALLPLLKGVVNNIENVGLPDCLTGPIARGDTKTINKHIEALKSKSPQLLAAYRELGLQTIPIALAKGKINRHQAEEMEAILEPSAEEKKTNRLNTLLEAE